MKKIKQFDLDVIHESGNFKLEGCEKIPTLEQFGGNNRKTLNHLVVVSLKKSSLTM